MKKLFCLFTLATISTFSLFSNENTSLNDFKHQFNHVSDLLKTDSKEKALELLDTILLNNPSNLKALFLRGDIHFSQNNYQAALDDFSKFIELQPENAKAYIKRSMIYFSIDDETHAYKDIQKAISFDPTIKDQIGVSFKDKKNTPGLHVRHKHGEVNIKNGTTLIKPKTKS